MKRRMAFALAIVVAITSLPANEMAGYAMEESAENTEVLSTELEPEDYTDEENVEFETDEGIDGEEEIISDEYMEEESEQLLGGEVVQTYEMPENEIAVQSTDAGVKFEDNETNFYQKYGDTVVMNATATANPGVNLSYQWYVKEILDEGGWTWTQIEGAAAATYKVTAGKRDESYLCKVTDSYGMTYERTYYITVRTLSTSLDELFKEIEVLPGGETKLKIDVTSDRGNDQITYKWSKYNSATNEEEELAGENGAEITVKDIQQAERYSCCVSDGNQTENYDFSIIIKTKIEINNEPENYSEYVSVEVGKDAELVVKATTNYGKLVYQWQKYVDDEWVDIENATSNRYLVKNVTESMDYRCKVSNGYEELWAEYEIEVDSGLVVEGGNLLAYYVDLGKSCTLEIKATTKYGKLTYQWEKWNDDKETYEKIDGATGTRLTVNNVREYAMYSCEISDGYEWRRRDFYVHVNSGFKVASDYYRKKAKVGEKVTLKAEASSNYKLQYQWYKEEKYERIKIDGATRATYEFVKPEAYEQQYYCIVSDGYNSEEIEYDVQLDTGFTWSAQQMVWVPYGKNATVQVKASTDEKYGPLEYIWYEVGAGDEWTRLPNITGSTWTAKNVTEIKTYLCHVENKYESENIYITVGTDKEKDALAMDFASAKTFEKDRENIVKIPIYAGMMYFKFVPDQSGIWKIYSDTDSYTQAWLYDANKRLLTYDNDGIGEEDGDDYNTNFGLRYELQGGSTYYIACGYRSDSEMGEFPVLAKYEGSGEHEHKWDKGVVTKQPTCGEIGQRVFTCAICGHEYVTPISATGKHSFGSYVVKKKATIFAKGSETRTCTVCHKTETRDIPQLKGTIKLTTTKLPLQAGKTVELSKIVTGLSAGDSIASCTSSDTKAATVTKKGTVTGKAAGDAIITIKLASGTTARVTINVQKKTVATATIGNVSKSWRAKAGEKKQLKPVIAPITTTDKVTYSSSNKSVATVSGSGLVTAKKPGTAKITVKSGKKKAVMTVTVAKPAATGMNGVPAAQSLKKGKSFTIKAKLTPSGADGKITFTSSNKKVVTVNSKGKVTGKAAGTATITVKSGKITRTCKVTVK